MQLTKTSAQGTIKEDDEAYSLSSGGGSVEGGEREAKNNQSIPR